MSSAELARVFPELGFSDARAVSDQALRFLLTKTHQRIHRLGVLIADPGFTNSQGLAETGANEISVQLAALDQSYSLAYVPDVRDTIFLQRTVSGKLWLTENATGQRRCVRPGEFAVSKYQSLPSGGAALLATSLRAKQLRHLYGEPGTPAQAADLLRGTRASEPTLHRAIASFLSGIHDAAYTTVGSFPVSFRVPSSRLSGVEGLATLCMQHGGQRTGYWTQTATPQVSGDGLLYLAAGPMGKLLAPNARAESENNRSLEGGMSVRRLLSKGGRSGKKHCLFAVSDLDGNQVCVKWIRGEHIPCVDDGPRCGFGSDDACWCLGNVFNQGGVLNSTVWVEGGFWAALLDIVSA